VQPVLTILLSCLLALPATARAQTTEELLVRAQQGDRTAYSLLKMQLTPGSDTRAGIERVIDGYRQGAIDGDTRAQFEFGFLLEEGIGIARDYRQAEGWYLKAAEKGHVGAQYRLGRMYHEGEATPSNRSQAYAWLAVAAAAGSAPAARLREEAAATLAPADLKKARAEADALAKRFPQAPDS
jgi:TPR repeat protein